MAETLLVFAGVVLLAILGLLGPLVPGEWVIAAGAACTLFGLLLGVPTGLWYHVRLRAVLRAEDRLPARWWIHPSGLHDQLPEETRAGVLRWFFVGGAGFAFTALGCVIATVGIGLVLFRS